MMFTMFKFFKYETGDTHNQRRPLSTRFSDQNCHSMPPTGANHVRRQTALGHLKCLLKITQCMEELESSGPEMNVARVVYVGFIMEGDQVLSLLEVGTAGCLSQLLQLGAPAFT